MVITEIVPAAAAVGPVSSAKTWTVKSAASVPALVTAAWVIQRAPLAVEKTVPAGTVVEPSRLTVRIAELEVAGSRVKPVSARSASNDAPVAASGFCEAFTSSVSSHNSAKSEA